MTSPAVPADPWPTTAAALTALQVELARLTPPAWQPPDRPLAVAGCFAAFPRGVTGPGATGDQVWAATVTLTGRRTVGRAVAGGVTDAPYQPGLLALRCGAVLEAAVRGLPQPPDLLIVDATARDHPRRAGLAWHLGAALDIPTIGVTHRPLLAGGTWPADTRGVTSAIVLDGATIGYWVRTRAGRRPLAVHAGWRTDPDTATSLILANSRHRTPEPLRRARHLARVTRAADTAVT